MFGNARISVLLNRTLMTPRIWYFREDDGTKPANTADPARKLSGANDR